MGHPISIDSHDALSYERAVAVADLTRQAYRHHDPVPGLPAADGASDTRSHVLGVLGGGGQVWLAQDAGGQMYGALRIRPSSTGWWVSRFAVHPDARGQGIGARLLGAVAARAHDAGVPALCLHAVVERELPQIYARRGFRVRLRWPAPDKPLTEVTMVRTTGTHEGPVDWPWHGDGAYATDAAVLTWWRSTNRMWAVVATTTTGPIPLVLAGRPADRRVWLAGADQWPGGATAAVSELRAGLRAQGGRVCRDGAIEFGRELPPVYKMPRRLSPRLQALWRCATGVAAPGCYRREARQ